MLEPADRLEKPLLETHYTTETHTYLFIFLKKEFKWVFPITDDNTFIRLYKPANKNPTAKNGLLLLQSYRFQMLQTLGLGYTPKRDVRPSC